LRETALSRGIPEESAMKPKKAIQYGTMIHKKFKILSKSQYKETLIGNIEAC
jgi:hypothetical protein